MTLTYLFRKHLDRDSQQFCVCVCVCVCVCERERERERETEADRQVDKKGSIEIHFWFIIGKLLGSVSN